MRHVCKNAAVALLLLATSAYQTSFASAQAVTEATITVSEAERQVRTALAASSATLEATKRQSDRALRRQLFQIEDLRAEIAELERGTTVASEQIEMLRNDLAVQEQRYVDALAERDRVYAEEIATYRRAVEDIAATPQGLAALTRFNAGEEAEALEILDRLRAARDLAAARRIAQLAQDALRRAKVSTQSVIARYEEITTLDPSRHWDWVELGRLLFQGGDLPKALAAARRAADTASTERDRSVALNELGDVQVAQGDLPGALASYSGGLEIFQRLAEADPGNAGWQRDLSVSFNKIGDVQRAQGTCPARWRATPAALRSASGWPRPIPAMPAGSAISRSHSPRSAMCSGPRGTCPARWRATPAALRSASGWPRPIPAMPAGSAISRVSFNKIGDVQRAQGDLPGALASYTSGLEIFQRLAEADPGNAGWQRDLSVTFERIGDVQRAQGDLPGALASYSGGLEIRERLAEADPGNAGWQRDLSVSFNKIGDVQRAQGDLPGALASYTSGLEIFQRLAEADPGNAGWQRDLSVTFERIGDVQRAQGDLPGALASYSGGLEIRERLAEADPGNAGWAARSLGLVQQDRRCAGGPGEPARRAGELHQRL